MSDLIAKPVVKNKFWVVEEQGEKVATIQARDDGGFVYVHDDEREYFSSVRFLKKKYNITFTTNKSKKSNTNNLYGFPLTGKAYNQLYDVKRKLPLYTKIAKSKSYFCAGYYIIKINHAWQVKFCPKSITLSRYEYQGPFKSANEAESLRNQYE